MVQPAEKPAGVHDHRGVVGDIELKFRGAQWVAVNGEDALQRAARKAPGFSSDHAGYYLFMVETGQHFRPGEVVPVSGIYRCDNDEHDDHRFESTDVRGHRFPPLPAGCRGDQWVLERATAHH